MSKIYAFYEKVLLTGLILSCLMIFIMTFAVSADVILRNLNLANLPWVVEISEYILFLATFLAAPWVLHKNGHIRVDLVISLIPLRTGQVVQTIADCLALAVCLFLLYYGTRTALEALQLNTMIFKQLVVPEWWLFSIIPVSGLLLTLEFLLSIFRRFGWNPVKDDPETRTMEKD